MALRRRTDPNRHSIRVLPVVADYLREVKDVDWDKLATHLGFSLAQIKEIEQDHPKGIWRQKMAMLDMWTRKEEDASWEKLIAALEKMDEKSLASQLRNKYLQEKDSANLIAGPGEATQLAAATSRTDWDDCSKPPESTLATRPGNELPVGEVKIDRKDKVGRELESLQESYLRLRTRVESVLEENVDPTPRLLKRFSQTYLINKVASTVEDLFDYLGEYSFLEYTLLEKIVSFFLKEEKAIADDLEKYIQQLTAFKCSTTIRDFMERIEGIQKSYSETELCTVTLRLVGGWLEKSIQDLEKLVKVVFEDKQSVLTHLKISIGSVHVTYLAPQSEIDHLTKCVQSIEKHSFMLTVGVYGLSIGLPIFSDEISHFSFESSLFTALKNDDTDSLEFLLDINTNPDAIDDEGQTALIVASASGQDKAVSILLNANANQNYQRHDGVTPLYMASQNGHYVVVNILLRAKANPSIPRNDGTTPLYIARQNGHASVISTLQHAHVGEVDIIGEITKLESVSIIIFGRQAAGTSLFTALTNKSMPESGIASEPSATSTKQGCIQVGKGCVNVFEILSTVDTPHNNMHMIIDLASRHDLKVVIIVCIEMYERLDDSTLNILAQLHKTFGQKLWFRMIFALTKADRYEENRWLMSRSKLFANQDVLKDRFAKELIDKKNDLKSFFIGSANQVCCPIGVTEKEFNDLQIPIIPTSELEQLALDKMKQIGHGYWFDILLIKCCQRLSGDSGLQIYRDRLSQLPLELVQQELGEDVHQELLRQRSIFSKWIPRPNWYLWQSYCNSVIAMPRFEISKKE